jgi:hypothetical protein
MSSHRRFSAPIHRLALNPDEAAAAIGVSRAFFFAAVLPNLKVVRVGSASSPFWNSKRGSRERPPVSVMARIAYPASAETEVSREVGAGAAS